MRDKGYTIIELILAVFLFGIFLTMVFTSSVFSMKTLSAIDKDVELQQQAQFIFNFMEDRIIESMGVYYLQDNKGYTRHDTNARASLGKIIFKNLPGRPDKGYIFSLSKDPEAAYYNLKYGIGLYGGASDEVGNYISSMEVEPIPSGKIYTEADGIVLRINFVLDGCVFACENSYHFRNSAGGI